MKIITITGSVGSGKTTLAKKLSRKLEYKYVDVTSLIKKNKIYDKYDKKDKSYVVDIKDLQIFLIELIEKEKKKTTKGIIIDSHLSHFIPNEFVDLCIITKCKIEELNKRLKERKYSKNKILENIECEIFDICQQEAKDMKHKILVIPTTKGLNMARIFQKVKVILNESTSRRVKSNNKIKKSSNI